MIRAKSEFSLARGNLLRRGRKGMIYCRFQHDRRRHLLSTGRFDEAGARVVAWQKYQEIIQGKGAEPSPRKVKAASVADCVDAYRAGATTMERPVKPVSMLTGIAAVRTICRTVWPDRPLASIKCSELDRDCVLEFRRLRRAEEGIPQEGDGRHNARLNRHVAKARAVFGAEARKLYAAAGLAIPEKVLQTVGLKEDPVQPRPVTPAQVWRAHLRVARAYKRQDPRCLVIFEVMRYAGLRNSEVLAMRRHWIRIDGETAIIGIRPRSMLTDPARETYRPKNGKSREVRIRASLLRRWLDMLPADDETAHLIPGDNRRQDSRWWRDLSATVGAVWPDRTKSLYELRKFAGSSYLTKTRDIAGTAKFLGDTIAVTYRHYADLLDDLNQVTL